MDRSRRTCASPGQYYDIETGWSHNGFRDYIPQLGRYAEPDPLAMQGSASFYSPGNGHLFSEYLLGFTQSHISPYAYVGNDPINLSDPLGLCPPKNNCPEKFKNFFSNINIYKNLAKRLNTKTLFFVGAVFNGKRLAWTPRRGTA